MKIAITGSHGLIGTALIEALQRRNDEVIGVQRSQDGHFLLDDIGSADAVIHLAGEGIGTRRWSQSQKNRIMSSRRDGTFEIASAIAKMKVQPNTFVCASAIGIYGDRGDEEITEQSQNGTGFLADVCVSWEAATKPAIDAGIRTINIRTGVVLSAKAGALAKQLPLFRHRLGGVIGSGRQYMSWISIDDEVRAILHLLDANEVHGPFNLTAPSPVTNAEFTKVLANTLGKPAILRVPGFALKVALGSGLASELLLGGQRVMPVALQDSGFTFEYSEIQGALRYLLEPQSK
ncbi:MAG TPA: TIGR01777 family oxidoreductase [Acidimicrobiales bacterium]|nr:TIGR01777 family oxidoreductase [Acidimicrobiales bacterium]